MIHMNNFEKFCSVLDTFKADNILIKLFGNKHEEFHGAFSGFSTPPNNALHIQVVALTSVGTIYCNQIIKLSNEELVNAASQLFSSLDISDCEISYSKESGTISFK